MTETEQTLLNQVQAELAALRDRDRLRELVPPPEGLDLVGSDYLGLATDHRVVDAGVRALRQYGAGGQASRLLGGGSPLHTEVEALAAEWLGADAALVFPSGYQANLGVLTAMVGPGDAVILDSLAHASQIDGARACRAEVLVQRHLDLEHLEVLLKQSTGARRCLVLTEAVFSMDGDMAPVAEMAALCRDHNAWLVVDEAHAVGLKGPAGAGVTRDWWDGAKIPASWRSQILQVVPCGKAMGTGGALVAGHQDVVQLLVNKARSFVYSTAVSPAVAGALGESIRLVRQADGARAAVRERANRLAAALELPSPAGAIVPVPVGSDRVALAAAEACRQEGFAVRAVRPPTVPEGSARLRLTVSSGTPVERLDQLGRLLRDRGLPGRVPVVPVTPGPSAPTVVIAGTDTGVGKTVVSALTLHALADLRPRYWKPVQTGSDDDTATVSALAPFAAGGPRPVWHLAKPASPHEAAAAEGLTLDPLMLHDRYRELRKERTPLVAELAGGLMVPFTVSNGHATTQLDVLNVWRRPVVLAARSGLGTLNHTLLSLAALRQKAIPVAALILVGPSHPSNRDTLAAVGGVSAVLELPYLDPLDAPQLAMADCVAPLRHGLQRALGLAEAPR